MLRRLFRRRRDPWTDPTLPRQCTATLDASECVREAHGDYGHCDSHGHQWDAPRPVHVTCREHAQRGNWRQVCAYCHQQLGCWPGPATRALLWDAARREGAAMSSRTLEIIARVSLAAGLALLSLAAG